MKTILNPHLWWIWRVILLPVYLFFFAMATFFLVRLIPGDPVVNQAAGLGQTAEQYAATQKALGLDGTLWEQLVSYLGRLVTLDFGKSFSTGNDVLTELSRVIPGTLEIAFLSASGIIVLAFVIGSVAISRPRGLIARAGTWIARTAGAVPDFVIGIFGIVVFYLILGIAPAPLGRFNILLTNPPRVTGFPMLDAFLAGDFALLGSMQVHLWLPCLTLVLAYGPILMKVILPSIEANAAERSTLFQVSTGWKKTRIAASVWRRSAPAGIAMFGTLFGFLLGGAVVVEQLFALQGTAAYAVNAVRRSDYLALQGMLIVVAFISLVVFLLVDILTGIVDPRRQVNLASA